MSSDRAWQPLSPRSVPDALAHRFAAIPGTVRVAIDGPSCARPAGLAESLVEPLRALGRAAAHVRAEDFWRDASVRLEFGRHDVESYAGWLDHGALRREVLDPVAAGAGYLPSLRDPRTNRSTREPMRSAADGTVLLVSGAFLLGLGLPFDVVVHLQMSPAARARRTPEDEAWTLPAYDLYDTEVKPSEVADMVVRMDDPRHPAVRGVR